MDNEDFQGQIVVRKRRDDDEEDHQEECGSWHSLTHDGDDGVLSGNVADKFDNERD